MNTGIGRERVKGLENKYYIKDKDINVIVEDLKQRVAAPNKIKRQRHGINNINKVF